MAIPSTGNIVAGKSAAVTTPSLYSVNDNDSERRKKIQEAKDDFQPRGNYRPLGEDGYGDDYIGEEYQKHIAAIRERFPLLTSLFLRGDAQDNANLSDIATTNKYARLADAYNAQMRYRPSGIQVSTGPEGSSVTWGTQDEYVPVEKLSTQDQKQMDLLREAQSDLRKYGLGEESHFQRDYLRRKLDEMQKLVDQSYKEMFFSSDEEMLRTHELFTKWAAMDDAMFMETMQKMYIPEQQARLIRQAINAGDFFQANLIISRMGGQPLLADAALEMAAAGGVVGGVATGKMSPAEGAAYLGRIKGDLAIQQIKGLINAAEGSGDPTIEKAVDVLRNLTNTALNYTGALNNILSGDEQKKLNGALISVLIFAAQHYVGGRINETVGTVLGDRGIGGILP